MGVSAPAGAKAHLTIDQVVRVPPPLRVGRGGIEVSAHGYLSATEVRAPTSLEDRS
jgi:hypothetical protein